MRLFVVILPALLFGGTLFPPCAAPQTQPRLPLSDSISIDGITWEFSAKVPVGRFVNGDYYVVGEVTVNSVRPAPTDERNGSVLNMPVNQGISGFDSRVSSNRFRANLRAAFPLAMKPGDAVVSSISLDTIGSYEPWLREGNNESPVSPVKTVSVLTCLASAVAADAFRPSYCDREQKIYHTGSLHRDLLPNLPKVDKMPDIKTWAWHFRRPWLDVCFFHFDAAAEYQAMYGREVARSVGIGTLMLMCDYTAAEKESLLVNIIQYGIDLWGIARAGYPGWQAHGGHGSGRKWPIIFAGIMLGDPAMASPNGAYPSLRFGEDMQTMHGQCWTGANVVYAGHQGVIDGKPASATPGWGPYEHKPPVQWADSNKIGEDYRRCCTGLSWVGEALAARFMNATSLWNHDAFFDYVDRWMFENDSAAVKTIKEVRGWDYTKEWARQGQCWDDFVENMWKEYRASFPQKITSERRPGRHGGDPRVNPATQLRFMSTRDCYTITGRVIPSGKGPCGGIVLVRGNGRNIYKCILLPP
ncbi:MAG: hypothetical protein JW913_05050 [Chitinispirillaceae bacterium]|nr:hypothetical protein [Chitinispirillaceae bacterium]